MERIELLIIGASVIAFAGLAIFSLFLPDPIIVLSVSFMVLIFPYFVYRSIVAARIKKLEDIFTAFLLDLGSIMETRISLMQAMPSIYDRDYGKLTHYVKRLHINTSWGMPFFDAFVKMGRDTKSDLINKSINVVMGTFVSGGDLKRIFSAIGTHIKEITKIKDAVSSRVKIISITCYFIFGCLLFSMYIIKTNFLPAFSGLGGGGFGAIDAKLLDSFDTLSFHLIMIQSLFAGLVTGQLAEDSVFAGVKHSIVLVAISVIMYSLF